MADVKTIIEHLNAPPFNKNYTLVQFDQLASSDLLSIVNEVFYALDSKGTPKDLKEEAPETTAYRMADFLRVLQYKHLMDSQQFQFAIIQGDRAVIYPILAWILPRLQELQKRAYLARFLVNIEVPAEYFQDEAVTDTFNQYKELQEAFKETHKQVEGLRKQARNPVDIRQRLGKLEEEKDQLSTKILNVQRRTQDMPNFDVFFSASSDLRKESDEGQRVVQQIAEQQQLLAAAQNDHRELTKRLSDIKASTLEGNPEVLVGQLRAEIAELTQISKSQLPADIEAKEQRRAGLQKIMTETASPEMEMQRLSDEITEINRQLHGLEEKRAQAQHAASGEDSKILMFRQQAGIVSQKKQETQQKLTAAKTAMQLLEAELGEKEKYTSSFRGGKAQALKGAAFKEYATKLREKSVHYKQLKSQIDLILGDLGIAQRTEQILKARLTEAEAKSSHLERQRGVAGYQETQAKLEQVSQKKSEVDEGKEKMLGEISKVVQVINSQIKERKSKLAPFIKELRPLRDRHAELEAAYIEKKKMFDNTAAGLETEMNKLEQEVSGYREDCQREEAQYHTLLYLSEMHENTAARMAEEEKLRAMSAGQRGGRKTLKDIYTAKIAELEALSREWREKQKKVKEGFKANLEQVQAFQALKQLLQLKLASLQADGGAPADAPAYQRQALDVADINRSIAPGFGQGQVDRLVL